jgi:hypothetical protein
VGNTLSVDSGNITVTGSNGSSYGQLLKFDECQDTIANLILDNAKSVEEKTETLEVMIRIPLTKNEMDAVNRVSRRALDVLGIYMPSKVTTLRVIRKLLRVKRLLRGKSDQALLALLPKTNDPVVIAAVKVLADQSGACLVVNGDEDQMVYSALLGVELSLTRGLALYTPVALAY